MASSQYSNDSCTIVEDQGLEKVAVESVIAQSSLNPSVHVSSSLKPNSIKILQSAYVSKDGPPTKYRGKKRLRFALDEDSEDNLSAGETVSKPVAEGLHRADLMVERIETLAKRNYDLEVRIEAIESASIKLLDSFKEWAEQTEKSIQKKNVHRDGPRKWLLWHSQYFAKKKVDWAMQAKHIYLQSGGFRSKDSE